VRLHAIKHAENVTKSERTKKTEKGGLKGKKRTQERYQDVGLAVPANPCQGRMSRRRGKRTRSGILPGFYDRELLVHMGGVIDRMGKEDYKFGVLFGKKKISVGISNVLGQRAESHVSTGINSGKKFLNKRTLKGMNDCGGLSIIQIREGHPGSTTYDVG